VVGVNGLADFAETAFAGRLGHVNLQLGGADLLLLQHELLIKSSTRERFF